MRTQEHGSRASSPTEPLQPVADRSAAFERVWVLAIAVILAAVFLSTYVLHPYAFPVGADAPVYIGWARLAGQEGLSAVGGRPGIPAITLLVTGALGTDVSTIVASLEITLAVTVALAAASLAMIATATFRGRALWVVTGALTGAYAAHLAVGYIATLAVGALFVAAAASIGLGSRRGAVAAAILLGAAGLAHPQFMAIAMVILLVTAGLSVLRHGGDLTLGSEPGRIGIAMVGGLGIFGVGMVSLMAGPAASRVDTSRDDFLQHSGLGAQLRGLFRSRLLAHAPVYAPWISLPLAIVGVREGAGFLSRFLRAWGVVLVVGVIVSLITGWIPPERLVTFAYVIPIAAAAGLMGLYRLIRGTGESRRRLWMGLIISTALALGMAVSWLGPWFRTPPQLFPTEVARVVEAGRYAAATPPGTRLVFTVSGRQPIASFFATQAGNAIRASIPADRIRDVRILVRPRGSMDQENRRLVQTSIREAFPSAGVGPASIWFDLAPFDRAAFGQPFGPGVPGGDVAPRILSRGVGIVGTVPVPLDRIVDPLHPASPWGIALATFAALIVMGGAGYGWARATTGPGPAALALSPAFGLAGLLLCGLIADRLGLSLSSRGVGVAGLLILTGSGLLVARRYPDEPHLSR